MILRKTANPNGVTTALYIASRVLVNINITLIMDGLHTVCSNCNIMQVRRKLCAATASVSRVANSWIMYARFPQIGYGRNKQALYYEPVQCTVISDGHINTQCT